MGARGVNKAILVGKLGRDPEVRYMQSGDAVCSLDVATSETWRDKTTGEQKEKTEWHKVSVFGKTAEFIGEYAIKGTQVYICGKLETRKYQDTQTGQDRYSTSIIVQWPISEIQILHGGKQKAQGQQQPKQNRPAQQQAGGGWNGQQGQQPNQQGQPQYNEPPMDFDDDIQF